MKQMLRICAACLIVAITCAAIVTTDARSYTNAPSSTTGRPEDRTGTVDVFIPLTYNPATSWSGRGGSSVDLDTAWGIGYGFGYNFSDHLQLNGILTFSSRDYTARIVNSDGSTRQYDNTLDSFTLSLNGVFYFLKGHIAPYVTGGVGMTRLDTNIPTGIASTQCWWDPWFGYVCGISVPTRTETDLSYTAGLGVRFDLGPRYSLQPSYNKMWIDVRRAGMRDFDVWRLDLVYRIP